MEKSIYEKWAENKFEGLTGEQLLDAGKIFGLSFTPTTQHKIMRKRLCEAAGIGAPSEVPEEVKPVTTGPQGRPGLAPTETWEGRRHRVRVSHSDADKGHKAFTITWNGDCRAFPFDKEFDMPEPWFNIMKNCVIKDLEQEEVLDNKGKLMAMRSYDVSRPRYSFHYMGITPGTEDLCGSVLEFWQRKAQQFNYFRDVVGKPAGRKVLIRILSEITEPRGSDYYKDRTTEEIHGEVLQYLGFESVVYHDLDSVLAA